MGPPCRTRRSLRSLSSIRSDEWTGTGRYGSRLRNGPSSGASRPGSIPGSLVWCLKKPGRDFREKVELWLAWKRVAKEIAEGTLGGDFDRTDRAEIQSKVADAEEAAKDEVWGGYRFVVIADNQEPDGLKDHRPRRRPFQQQ